MNLLPFALALLAITIGLPAIFAIVLYGMAVIKEKISKKFEKTLDKMPRV